MLGKLNAGKGSVREGWRLGRCGAAPEVTQKERGSEEGREKAGMRGLRQHHAKGKHKGQGRTKGRGREEVEVMAANKRVKVVKVVVVMV